ncbi:MULTISPECIES: nitrilase-related carbon-nitrogen hydrolase [unclassified Wenzhouxiangella]|uniref:nitrilase-related carbon-nitrogen hydrolase n=1 Tax=unclassified Wenzhouxiangella TaxID=2613841 RepID=UPI000E3295FF|nr:MULTISPECIES: nitrilase-related carbon-nitrogen hydrolase [unclassified Wenzhouxiangella]RFF26358.1 amidohydrolase [Wenzhouxiangella sp. 15181]RFP67370.1 amidohydrolase [Wenzhouxiangella sp. 15190]
MATPVAPTLEVGLVQADLAWQDPETNRHRLAAMMDTQPRCDLYVIPETFSTGFLGDAGLEAETMDGPSVAWMREQARSRAAALTGSLVIDDGSGRRFNRMVFMSPEGEATCYDKRHRFGFGGESQRYTAGERQVVVEWRGWRIDLQICFDLRFPVWCRNDRNFDIQLFVANWPAPRADHWSALLRARAIENQAFVIAVNRAGVDGNEVEYPGCSSVWDAAGKRVVELGEDEATARVSLSRQALTSVRTRFPFLADADRFKLGKPDL